MSELRTRTAATTTPVGIALLAVLSLLMLMPMAAPADAQTALDRPPNLGGTWVGGPGVVHFHFLHRFVAGDAPQRKVNNGPTFLLAAGLPYRTLVGARYSTNSSVVAGIPNEWEFFGRIAALQQSLGAPLDASVHAGYNHAAESFDGELTVARRLGRLRVLAIGRGFSDAFNTGESRWAVGGGATLRLTSYVALSGDVVTLLDVDDADAAWGAGLQLQIPYTPHSLSLQVTNTNSATLQGASIGTGTTRYGFEFTVPVTLARYFGRPATGAAAPTPAPVVASGDTVRVVMRNLAYATPALVVRPGTTVVWVNEDAVAHTATANDSGWDSGLIEPGASWSGTFGQPGTYAYHCTPHPFMTGTVTVR